MKENKVIGRSLADLMEEHHVDDVLDGETIIEVPLEEISPNPFQPRIIFEEDKIDELAKSIEEHGVFQPIILKKVKEGYIIVSGERRYRASKKLGLETIPSIIRAYTEAKVAEIALAENLQREDLTPIEEAEAYKVVMEKLELTQTELADKIGKSRSHVTNMLGLLNLPDEVQEKILTKEITMGHARALSKLKDENIIIGLCKKIIKEDLSVRQTEEITKKEEKKKKINRTSKNEQMKYKKEKDELSKKYNAKVKIGNNKITLEFNDEENFIDGLLRMIRDEL